MYIRFEGPDLVPPSRAFNSRDSVSMRIMLPPNHRKSDQHVNNFPVFLDHWNDSRTQETITSISAYVSAHIFSITRMIAFPHLPLSCNSYRTDICSISKW